jgi:hypothetical protein
MMVAKGVLDNLVDMMDLKIRSFQLCDICAIRCGSAIQSNSLVSEC